MIKNITRVVNVIYMYIIHNWNCNIVLGTTKVSVFHKVCNHCNVIFCVWQNNYLIDNKPSIYLSQKTIIYLSFGNWHKTNSFKWRNLFQSLKWQRNNCYNQNIYACIFTNKEFNGFFVWLNCSFPAPVWDIKGLLFDK